MNTEKLTQKTIEALRGAQNAATENGNPSVEEEHLLYALLTQPDGLVGEVMRSVGASPEDMIAELDRLIAQFPKAGGSGYDPSRIYISASLDKALTEAEKQAAAEAVAATAARAEASEAAAKPTADDLYGNASKSETKEAKVAAAVDAPASEEKGE